MKLGQTAAIAADQTAYIIYITWHVVTSLTLHAALIMLILHSLQ